MCKVFGYFALVALFLCIDGAVSQGTGSGTNGKLRLCIVEGRGPYKRGTRYCPVLDAEQAGVECVIGVDRLDCLRRMHKKTVDFGVFSPEDLVAAQWTEMELLVTDELRLKHRPFARSIVAVVNNRILPDRTSDPSGVLRNRTLCHPAADADDLRPLSDTLVKYLESLVTRAQCDPALSLTENRIKATADFFAAACMAGPWVPDTVRDRELKRRYPSLCAACASRECLKGDLYWGDSGALNCVGEAAGDFTWADLDDVRTYFQNNPNTGRFSFLCRDGSHQPLDTAEPCVWLHQPWPVVIAKRKAAAEVSALMSSLSNVSMVETHWRGALTQLLEVRGLPPAPLSPARTPADFLAQAQGFTEAYTQHACNPPRHVTLCTTSVLASNKCSWLAEAGAVYGVTPPLQCARRDSAEGCMAAVRGGEADVVVADGDWLVKANRNYSLTAVLHEATPILDKTVTISAYVRSDSGLDKMADLRGKRAAFPRFDGLAWHAALRLLAADQKQTCRHVANEYFNEICAPGIEAYNVTEEKKEQYTRTCYKENGNILSGEEQALRALVEGKADVAFIQRNTYNKYKSKLIQESWAKDTVDLKPVCPEENKKYCLVSWSNLGHVFASNNLTHMRRQEIVNVLTNLDQLFGNHAHQLMFSMYGAFNHELDVIFHNNTGLLVTDEMFQRRPYNEIPLSFERSLNASDICQYSDFTTGHGSKYVSNLFVIWFLVVCAIILR